MVHALAMPDPAQVVPDLIPPLRGHRERDGISNGFRGRVPVKTLRGAIPGRHDPFQGLPDDGVIRGFDDGRETRPVLLGLRPLGHVVGKGAGSCPSVPGA